MHLQVFLYNLFSVFWIFLLKKSFLFVFNTIKKKSKQFTLYLHTLKKRFICFLFIIYLKFIFDILFNITMFIIFYNFIFVKIISVLIKRRSKTSLSDFVTSSKFIQNSQNSQNSISDWNLFWEFYYQHRIIFISKAHDKISNLDLFDLKSYLFNINLGYSDQINSTKEIIFNFDYEKLLQLNDTLSCFF